MVYALEYTDKNGKVFCLFDIDMYLQPREYVYEHGRYYKDDSWRSEMVKTTNSRGIAKFVYDMTQSGKFTDAEMDEFLKDCETFDFLRSHLHEDMSNPWLSQADAGYAFYHTHLPDIKKIIVDFANKWNLSIHED